MNKDKFAIFQVLITISAFLIGVGIGGALSSNFDGGTESYSVASDTPARNYYSTREGVIFKGSDPIQLKGVNWFGFETQNHVAHGLWSRAYKGEEGMISQMKEMGINAVRVPVCPATLNGTNVDSVDYSKNPDLQNLNSIEALDKVLRELNANQMYILLDMHRVDAECSYISDLWTVGSYTEADWISDLQKMANRFSELEYLMGIDLKNEPHGSATWGTGNSATDWNTAAEKAGKAVLDINPNVLIFVEGVQENSVCSDGTYSHWWGGNLEPFACDPIDPEFIPKSKLVLSPHVYGPDVFGQAYFNDEDFPNNMPTIWDQHFGYLVEEGYTIVPGEWGGKYGLESGNTSDPDRIWQDALVDYFLDRQICNSFYWSWNPNSGDTGGILQDDWSTIHSEKREMLNNYWNSCQLPEVTISPIENPTNPVEPPENEGILCAADVLICPDGSFVNRDPDNQCQFKPCISVTTSVPTTIGDPYSTSSSPTTIGDPYYAEQSYFCDVEYKVVNQWNNGFVADVVVTNLSGQTIDGWNLVWDFPGNQKVTNTWNIEFNQSGQEASGQDAGYNGKLETDASTNFGFQATYSGENAALPGSAFTLNGNRCQ